MNDDVNSNKAGRGEWDRELNDYAITDKGWLGDSGKEGGTPYRPAPPSIEAYTDCWQSLEPRMQTLMLVMRDLLQLVPIAEQTITEDGAERLIVGVGERDSLDAILAVTCHEADAYNAMLTVLQRLGYQLQATEWWG